MATLANQKNISVNTTNQFVVSESIIDHFFTWCKELEDYRYPILAAIVIIQGNLIIPPLLLLSLNYNIGLGDIPIVSATITTMAVMVTNMSLSSMKVIVITFALSLLINISLILVHFVAMVN